MRKTLFILTLFTTVSASAQDKVYQWSQIPNYNVKGDNGVLIINLPSQAVLNFIVTKVGDPKIIYNWHTGMSQSLPTGDYEVNFQNIKIPFPITKQMETRIYAGVLNVTVKRPWEVWSDTVKVFGSGGAKAVALPAGKYIIKTSGVEIKTTIKDGQVSLFNYGGM